MLRIGICDNDLRQLDMTVALLEHTLSELEQEHNILCFSSGALFCDYVFSTKGDFDFVFINCNIAAGRGIEIATRIRQAFPHIGIVMGLSSYDQLGAAFAVRPMYLYKKPLERKEALEALQICIAETRRITDNLFVLSVGGTTYTLQLNCIKYIESDRRILTIHEEKRSISLYAKLGTMEELLDRRFIRCHQSYLVSADYIQEFSSSGIKLFSGEEIPISKQRYPQAREHYLNYIETSEAIIKYMS